MDNCTRCDDPATTTMNGARYCNPCGVEAAKDASPAMFDRAITPAEERQIYEAFVPVSAADVLAGRGPMRLVGTASLVE